MIHPRVSVIIRAFNAEKFIKDSLLSIYRQSYNGPIEVIICFDKGSTTRKAIEIANEVDVMFKNNARILKIIEHAHMSPFRALIKCGFSNVTGDYVFVLDYDDAISCNYVKALVNALKSPGSIAFSKIIWVNESMNKICERPVPNKIITLNELLYRNKLPVSSMFSKKALEILLKTMSKLTHPVFDWIFEDYLTWLILVKEGFNFIYVPEATFYYRIHSHNITAYMRSSYEHVKVAVNRVRRFTTLMAFYKLYRDRLGLLLKMKLFKRLFSELLLYLIL